MYGVSSKITPSCWLLPLSAGCTADHTTLQQYRNPVWKIDLQGNISFYFISVLRLLMAEAQ